jgi:hypothetical protein
MTIDDVAVSNRENASETFRWGTGFDPGSRPASISPVEARQGPKGIERNGPLGSDANGKKSS